MPGGEKRKSARKQAGRQTDNRTDQETSADSRSPSKGGAGGVLSAVRRRLPQLLALWSCTSREKSAAAARALQKRGGATPASQAGKQAGGGGEQGRSIPLRRRGLLRLQTEGGEWGDLPFSPPFSLPPLPHPPSHFLKMEQEGIAPGVLGAQDRSHARLIRSGSLPCRRGGSAYAQVRDRLAGFKADRGGGRG